MSLIGISSFSHTDNALELCGLLTPLHIVPEWYFLCQYAMLKGKRCKIASKSKRRRRDSQWKVDRELANHSLSSTASQGTSDIPFPWFLMLGCNSQAQDLRSHGGCRIIGPKVAKFLDR